MLAYVASIVSPIIERSVEFFLVFGAVFAYLPQYVSIKGGKGEAFSTFVCFVLLTSNVLRLFFRIGNPFSEVLVYQSVVMILLQTAMLEACVNSRRTAKAPVRILADMDIRHFWAWDSFLSYIAFLASFSAFVGFWCIVFLDSPLFFELLGFLALLTESTLGLPQVIRNAQQGTAGLSTFLIGSWVVGDVIKTFYFIYLTAPVQFAICGLVQISVDLYIVHQMIADKKHSSEDPSTQVLP